MDNINDKNKDIIKIIESGLHESGIDFMVNYINNDISYTAKYFKDTNSNEEKYNEINNWLHNYVHKPFVICTWTGKEISAPEAQLLNRFQNYNKFWCDNADIDLD